MHLSHKSLRIKHHDIFFTKRSSEDYDDEGAIMATIPFNWESQPGTPKMLKSREMPLLPPLTPPPSYFYSTPKKTAVKHNSKPKLLDSIFPKRLGRKPRVQLSPDSSSSSSSRSSYSASASPWSRAYSVPSSPITASNVYARGEKEDREYEYSVSTPCFGGGRTRAMCRGFCSTMFKALLREK